MTGSDSTSRNLARGLPLVGAGGVAFALGFLLSTSITVACGTEEPEPARHRSSSIDEVINEWRQRERRFDSVHLKWHVVRNSLDVPNNYQIEFPSSREQPEMESFWISGNRIRYESRRWYADLAAEIAGFSKENLFSKLVEAMRRGDDDVTKWDRPPFKSTLVWTETSHRELLEGAPGTPPLGTIRDAAASLRLGSGNEIPPDLMFWPVLMAFRPAIAIGGLTPDRLALEARPVILGNHRCLVISNDAGVAPTLRLCVDPEQGFAVIRASAYDKGHLCQQVDVEYTGEMLSHRSPSAWTIMVFNNGEEYPGQAELFRSLRVEVDDQTVNEPVDSDLFAVEFPVETIVNDRLLERAYVVLEKAQTRSATSRESRILAGRAEPTVANFPPGLSRNSVLGGAIVIALGVLWALRRRRRSKMTNDAD